MKKLFIFLSMLIVGVVSVYALPPAAEGYVLTWSDEFNGTDLDTTAWNYPDSAASCSCSEMEYYTRSCVTVENGNLVIWSKYSSTFPHYPSGRIDSHDKKIFTYGYFECRMIMPVGQVSGPGLFSAVWLLGNSINHGVAWPTCGEMELYEQRPSNAVVSANMPEPVPATICDNEFIGTCHYGVNGGASYHSCAHDYGKCLCDGFHKYGILWDTTYVKYYFDDVQYWGPTLPSGCGTPSILQAANQVAFSSPFFWIINSAIGGNYQGQNIDQSSFPLHMDLDYVRVYQQDIPVGVVNGVKKATLQSFALVNPSTAQLRVYNLSGKLVADYSSKVRQMKTGDNVMNMVPSLLSTGAYVVKLIDNGASLSRMLATLR